MCESVDSDLSLYQIYHVQSMRACLLEDLSRSPPFLSFSHIRLVHPLSLFKNESSDIDFQCIRAGMLEDLSKAPEGSVFVLHTVTCTCTSIHARTNARTHARTHALNTRTFTRARTHTHRLRTIRRASIPHRSSGKRLPTCASPKRPFPSSTRPTKGTPQAISTKMPSRCLSSSFSLSLSLCLSFFSLSLFLSFFPSPSPSLFTLTHSV